MYWRKEVLYLGILAVLAGLAIGSFLNVLIFRSDELKSVLNSRSHCMHCKKEIRWYDLIPVISYILLRGKCRNCGKNISIQYPLVEAGTAGVFLSLYLTFGMTWQAVFYALIFSIMIVIFIYDLKTQYILDVFSWPALILSLGLGWYFGHLSLTSVAYGVLTGAGLLAVLVLVSKEKWMGMGDIIIGAAFGAMLGYPRSLAFIFIAFVLGSIVGLVLIASKKRGLKDAVPFAPFMIAAGFITLIWGQTIVNWYLGTLFMY